MFACVFLVGILVSTSLLSKPQSGHGGVFIKGLISPWEGQFSLPPSLLQPLISASSFHPCWSREAPGACCVGVTGKQSLDEMVMP